MPLDKDDVTSRWTSIPMPVKIFAIGVAVMAGLLLFTDVAKFFAG